MSRKGWETVWAWNVDKVGVVKHVLQSFNHTPPEERKKEQRPASTKGKSTFVVLAGVPLFLAIDGDGHRMTQFAPSFVDPLDQEQGIPRHPTRQNGSQHVFGQRIRGFNFFFAKKITIVVGSDGVCGSLCHVRHPCVLAVFSKFPAVRPYLCVLS
jgi:hypothetical protein